MDDAMESTDEQVPLTRAEVPTKPVNEVDPYETVAPSPGDRAEHRPSPALDRFRVLRSLARGGLGEVFVALDGELGREVALKEIQDRHADHPASLARFLLEAEVTGRLEHPGIVPIYARATTPTAAPTTPCA